MKTPQLDQILQNAVDVLEDSKEQIFEIAEEAREECLRLEQELTEIKRQTIRIIEEVDACEKEEKRARLNLLKVNRDTNKYSEQEMKEAYDAAYELQVKLALLRDREIQLKRKRHEVELRHVNMQQTAEKAEKLVTQVGVAMSYLTSSLQNIWEEIEKLQQQQQVGFAIIKAQEEERRRVARGIHDGPAQSLANVVLRAEYCEQLIDKKPAELKKELTDLKIFARANLEHLRKIIFDLRPMNLDEFGLITAIESYVLDFEIKNQIPVEITIIGDQRTFNSATEVAVFRIIQEALNNILKHSQATQVEIIIETTSLALAFSIRDNGVGFDITEPLDNECFGLKGMKEWVSFLKGSFKINSNPKEGTIINVKIPLEEERR
ncbi:MAG: sensor histidine kinase [Bacillota bacterium]